MQLGFTKKDSSLVLVGHVPLELSRLVANFLGASKMNSVSAQVCRNRKREVGLIIPGLYRARMKKSKFGKILAKEITEHYRYFDFSLEQDIIFKPALKKKEPLPQKPDDMTRIINIKRHLQFRFCIY